MANTSYIRILNAIELFSKEHMQVKRFASDFPAQIPNFGTETEQYPILFVSPTSGIFGMNITTFTIDVYCFDIIQKSRANINTILSDCHLILSDLNRWILDGDPAGFDIIDIEPTITPIDNALLDYAAGWKMTLTLECETYGVCEIPFLNSPIISEVYNDIIYPMVLTCETLETCAVIQDIQQQIIKPYKVYSSLMSVDETSGDVTNKILENTLGYIEWVTNLNGLIVGMSNGLFTEDKTFVLTNMSGGLVRGNRVDDNNFELLSDVVAIVDASIELRVYN